MEDHFEKTSNKASISKASFTKFFINTTSCMFPFLFYDATKTSPWFTFEIIPCYLSLKLIGNASHHQLAHVFVW